MIENILISDKSLNEIKMGFGYPVIDGEGDYLFNDVQIKDYVIAPALETYFNYFPIKEIETFTIGSQSSTTISLPDQFFGIVDQKFIPQSSTQSMITGPTGNAFYTESLITNRGYGMGRFGTPFNFGYAKNTYLRKFYNDSVQNYNKIWYTKIDYENSELYMYASIPGKIDITWGLYTNDFDNATPLRKRQELISFCRSLYKKKIGEIISLQNSGLPEQIDFDRLIDSAEEEIERLKTKWADEGRVTVMR
jgi:hypothetical protein